MPLAKGFQLPTLVLSATARPVLIDQVLGDYFPRPTIFQANAASPHVTIQQCADNAFAQTRLIPDDIPEDKITPDHQNENNRRARRAREVWRYVRLVADGNTLVICQQGLENMLCEGLAAGLFRRERRAPG